MVTYPFQGDSITSSSRHKLRHSRSSCCVAEQVGACEVLDRIVVWGGSNVSGPAISLVNIIDPGTKDPGVGRNCAHKRSECGGTGFELHFVA